MFLKDRESIIFWLNQHKIEKYTLIEDREYGFIVDVDGYVDLFKKQLEFIPVKFNVVKGYFNCAVNNIVSLQGCPKSVGGYFDCHSNQITSLLGGPTSVGGDFDSSHNKLTSIEGSPTSVGRNFYCHSNPSLGIYQTITDFNELKNRIISDREKELLSNSLEKCQKTILHKV